MSASRILKYSCLLLIIAAIAFNNNATAQMVDQRAQAAGTQQKTAQKIKIKPIHAELSLGLRLLSDGWGVFVDKGVTRAAEDKTSDMFHNIRLIQVEFVEHKDPKEVKIAANNDPSTGGSGSAGSYAYGKINNFYAFKLGYGFRKMIAGKPEPGTVSIHWVGLGGLALGLEKPYYIDAVGDLGNRETIKYSDSTKGVFLNENRIIGSSGFTKGISEISMVFGLHAKTGLHFDFASSRHTVLAVETGMGAEFYTSKVPIMANQDPKQIFLNFYASFQFGGRW